MNQVTTYTDALGNVFDGITGALVTAGSGPLVISQANGNWVDDNGTVIGPIVLPNDYERSHHVYLIAGAIIYLLLIFALLKFLFK